MPGVWKKLKNKPAFGVDTALLLTDGGVMCHEYETSNWHKLAPDDQGSYIGGTWHSLTPLST